MSAVFTTAAGAPPAFLSASYVRKDCDTAGQVVASSGQTLAYRIYQMDPTAQWTGTLGADDTKTETITVGLYAGSAQATRSIDCVFLLGHNIDAFKVEYCADYTPGTGGAAGTGTWATFVDKSAGGQAGADYFHQLSSPVSANGLRLTMTKTSPANQQKLLGCFIAALSTFQPGESTTPDRPPMKFVATPAATFAEVINADKSRNRTYFYWSDNSFLLNHLAFDFDLLADADKTQFDALMGQVDPFLVWPEPGDVPGSVYLCIPSPGVYAPDYSTDWKGAGRRFKFECQQVGYL